MNNNWSYSYHGNNPIEAFTLLSKNLVMGGAPRSIIAGIINCCNIENGNELNIEAKNEIDDKGMKTSIEYSVSFVIKKEQDNATV